MNQQKLFIYNVLSKYLGSQDSKIYLIFKIIFKIYILPFEKISNKSLNVLFIIYIFLIKG